MAGVEGENADHLTTTTPAPPRAQLHCSVISWSLVSFKTWGRWKNRFVFEIGKKDEKAWKCRNEKTSILERRPIRRKRGKSRPFQSGKSDTLFTIISAKSWRQDFDFSCLQMDQCQPEGNGLKENNLDGFEHKHTFYFTYNCYALVLFIFIVYLLCFNNRCLWQCPIMVNTNVLRPFVLRRVTGFVWIHFFNLVSVSSTLTLYEDKLKIPFISFSFFFLQFTEYKL